MKKYLCMLAVVGLASSAFAQGTVSFANAAATVVKDPAGVAVPAGNGFAQLFWAPAGSPFTAWVPNQSATAWLAANKGWVADPKIVAIGPAAGRFNLGTLTLQPLAAGGNVDAVLVAWQGSHATFDAAVGASGNSGMSTKIANVKTGDPTTTPAGFPTALGTSFTGLTLQINNIPEPSALALAGLGAAALMIFRRRA